MSIVFFDIDTQIDFVYPAGALYTPGAERTLPAVAALNRYAAGHAIPLISTMDAHAEDDAEFQQWPHHCVVETVGQRKPANTLLERRLIVPSERAGVSLAGIQQILLEKQHIDCFTNRNLASVLAALDAERFVVYGVVTEVCVKCAAFGLLKTGKRVEIVTDAVRCLDEKEAAKVLIEFREQGGHLTTAANVTR
ncbi:MAG TPA: isochorismatase family cysteine hydrolase [Bryobacteraceae bacterium]|nr:isochorismatase family cysteine hydrolase [Bryobacteraceae bacterium]